MAPTKKSERGSVPGGLDATTIASSQSPVWAGDRRVAGLTILAHPDSSRVGARAPLGSLETGATLSRVEPGFFSIDGSSHQPIADPHVSRNAVLRLEREGGLKVLPGAQRFELDGRPVHEPVAVSEEDLRSGVVLVLAGRVALLLHEMTVPPPDPLAGFDLVGVSSSLIELQREVERVRDLQVPVLLRGETGTGKELVARAIHGRGVRSAGPFVAVNMAALPPSLAAAELFGAAKGAFTGADRPRPGLFREASGGTLFLDEIGAMPSEVQVLLLRFLEDHEVRSVGATRGETVDVRVVAATDSDLDRAVAAGEFSQPLLQRFGGYEISLPALRQRKDDLGLLLVHFLRSELGEIGASALLSDPGPRRFPWLPADLMVGLSRYSWPGNVRELRNFARRLAIRYHDQSVPVTEVIGRLTAETEPPGEGAAPEERESQSPPKRSPNKSYRDPREVSERELEDAMQAARWDLKRAAHELGVSRPSLYNLIDRHPALRRASEIEAAEIEAASSRCGGSLELMSEHLRVSRNALASRMRDLGLPRA